jgi:hypothetical protein
MINFVYLPIRILTDLQLAILIAAAAKNTKVANSVFRFQILATSSFHHAFVTHWLHPLTTLPNNYPLAVLNPNTYYTGNLLLDLHNAINEINHEQDELIEAITKLIGHT